jgi:hypothetical protein
VRDFEFIVKLVAELLQKFIAGMALRHMTRGERVPLRASVMHR